MSFHLADVERYTWRETSVRAELEQVTQQLLPWLEQITPFLDTLAADPSWDWKSQVHTLAQILITNFKFPKNCQFPPDKIINIALALHLLSTRNIIRRNGIPYTIHPIVVAWLILTYAHDIPEEQIIKTLADALTHDVLEEDVLRFLTAIRNGQHEENVQPAFLPVNQDVSITNNLQLIQSTLNQVYQHHCFGCAALDLMEPYLEEIGLSKPEKIALYAYWLNYRARFQVGYRNVKIADNIHNLSDLKYIIDNTEMDTAAKKEKLVGIFAKRAFVVSTLAYDDHGQLNLDVSQNLLDMFWRCWHEELRTMQLHTGFKLPFSKKDMPLISTRMVTLAACYERNKKQFHGLCTQYAKTMKLPTQINTNLAKIDISL